MTRLFSLIAVLFALTGCSGAPYPTALHVEATPAPVAAPMESELATLGSSFEPARAAGPAQGS